MARRRGDLDRAREFHRRALDTATDLGDSSREALARRGLAAVARETGELGAAAESIHRALALTDATETRSEPGRIRLEAARLALARGETELARERAEQARGTFEALGEPLWLARSRRLLGRIAAAEGDHRTARTFRETAVDSFERIGAVPDHLLTLEAAVCAAPTGDARARTWRRRARETLVTTPDAAVDAHGGWLDPGESGGASQPTGESL